MNPTSRLRTRARSERDSAVAGRSFSTYLPSVGVSSRPRIDNSVDLPQPDGPAIDTYSPLLISMLTLSRAWVSTSSVKNTLFTPSRTISVSLMCVLSQSDLVNRVPVGHVRKDHLIAGGQSAQH